MIGTTNPFDPGEPSTGVPRVSVAADEEALLREFSRDRIVCEIGTGLGISTEALCYRARSVTTVDIDPWVHETTWPSLPRMAKTLRTKPTSTFDLVFIDGDHREDAVREDVTWALAHCSGFVICHDAYEPDVLAGMGTEATWSIIHTTYGLGITAAHGG